MTDFSGEEKRWDGPFEIVECKKALSPSGFVEMDFCVNPYGGCEHGCVYCFAPAHTHSDPSTWRVVKVRRNIASRLSRELPFTEGVIGIGTVTDPYQAAESRFGLTRECLAILKKAGRTVHIHTKSDLVLRDVDLLSDMDVIVGITITTVDDRVSKMTEPGAPLPKERLKALKGLTDAGVKCYALIAPVMSSLEGRERELIDAIVDTGCRTVYYSNLNQKSVNMERLDRMGIGSSQKACREIERLCNELGISGTDPM